MYECFYTFEFEGEYLIYDYYNGVIFEISEKMYTFLRNRINIYNDPQYENERNSFDELIKEGYLLANDYLDENDEESSAFLSFAPAYRCNLRCKYCFARYGSLYDGEIREYSSSSLKQMLDFFFYQAFPNRQNYRINFVSGGEPLVNFDIIRQTVEYCEEIIVKRNINVKIWLCTNGTLLTEEICAYLDTHRMTIGISIDGPKPVHDRNRVNIMGSGTYDKIVGNIRQILDSKTLSSRFKGIWGLSVLNNDNLNLTDIVTHHRDIGLRDAQIKIERKVIPCDFDYEPYKKAYLSFMQHVIKEATKGDYSKLRLIMNAEDYLGKYLLRLITNQYTIKRCNAGKSKITICPNGDIYPCDSFVGIQEMKLGNMFVNPNISTVLKSIYLRECEPCKDCPLRYLCGGDCYYNSYINTGSVNVVHPKMCDLLKYLCKLSIWGCYHLQKEAKDTFAVIQAEMIRIDKIRQQI